MEAHLWPALILDQAGNLYGTTVVGGTGCSVCGTVFELTPKAGGSWTKKVLHNFNVTNGAEPYAGLIFDPSGSLYGTTYEGGGQNLGTVYKLTPSHGGWAERVLYSFKPGRDGGGFKPSAGLIFDSSGNLYGTTSSGGASSGTVFRLTPGSGGAWTENVLYQFTGGDDGGNPAGGVILDAEGNLYGMTPYGGSGCYCGVVFELTPNADGSWKENVLHTFTGGDDGGSPGLGSLVMDTAGNLYGTTGSGGLYAFGTVFKLAPSTGNWKETVLHSFKGRSGDIPYGSLIFDSLGDLYSTTTYGRNSVCTEGGGIVFKLAPNSNGGWNERVLHTFGDHPGANPFAGVIFDPAGNLFGTTAGDDLGTTHGSVFEITL
jgi:uncharacterized repeat protein (TIGR03803 family)